MNEWLTFYLNIHIASALVYICVCAGPLHPKPLLDRLIRRTEFLDSIFRRKMRFIFSPSHAGYAEFCAYLRRPIYFASVLLQTKRHGSRNIKSSAKPRTLQIRKKETRKSEMQACTFAFVSPRRVQNKASNEMLNSRQWRSRAR